MSRPDSEAREHDDAELDRFSDAFMDYLFEHGHLSKSFRPWWQSRMRMIASQPPRLAMRMIRSVCKDHLEMTRHWPDGDVAALDAYLTASGSMTMTTLRHRLWRGASSPSPSPSASPSTSPPSSSPHHHHRRA